MSDSLKSTKPKNPHLTEVEAPPITDAYCLAAEDKAKKRSRPKRRFSWRVLLARVVAYGLIATAVLVIGLYTILRLCVTPQDVANLIKQVVEEQTGGRLDIGAVKFNVLTGISLEKVEFYPPTATDTRGYRSRGEIQPIALANFDALSLQYSIPRLLTARFHVKALQLVNPQVHLRQSDGAWNFAGITAYRRVNFGVDPIDVTADEESGDLPAWIKRYGRNMLYLPFEVLAQNIGIKNLTLDLIKEDEGKIAQILQTSGLTVDVGLQWQGLSNALWIYLPSPFEHPFELDIKEALRDAAGKLTTNLGQTLSLKAAMQTRLQIVDLSRFDFDFAIRILKLSTPQATHTDLTAFMTARIEFIEGYKGLALQRFNVNVLDAIDFDLRGKVTLPGDGFSTIDLKLEEQLHIELAPLAALAAPWLPGLKAQGTLDFKDMWIEGAIEPARLSKIMEVGSGVQMPWISAAMWMKDVTLAYQSLQLTTAPINGSVAFATGPALGGRGSQIDVTMDVDVPKFEASEDLGKLGLKGLSTATFGVENLLSTMSARMLIPEMTVPIFKFNAEAAHVTTSGGGLSAIDVPFYADIDAGGRQDLQRLSLNTNIELEGLAELMATATCQVKCEKFRANASARIDSLTKLHAIALPLASFFGHQDKLPTQLAGSLDFQLTARGKLPDPATLKVADAINQGDVRFSTQLNVNQLAAELPLFHAKLHGLESRILASGTLRQQTLAMAQKFTSMSIDLPMKEKSVSSQVSEVAKSPPLKTIPIKISGIALDATFNNEIAGTFDAAKPLAELVSDVQTKLSIGEVAAQGLLPHALSDLQATLSASQSRLQDLILKELTFHSPDFGSLTQLSGTAKLAGDLTPEALTARLKTQVRHNGEQRLPADIKTSGQVDLDINISAEDMRQIAITGRTNFDQFNILIPAPDPKSTPLLVISDMNGQIPFRQRLDLPQLLAQLEQKKKNNATVHPQDLGVAEPTAAVVQDKDVLIKTEDSTTEDQFMLETAMQQYFSKNNNQFMQEANVAALVDYGSIRPFFPTRKPLSIKRIEAANLEFSDMEFDIELRQNWLAINQFMISFLGGKIQGDFQLAFDPLPESLRTSVHMSNLDSRKLLERFPNLKGKTKTWNLFSNPYLAGNVHVKYDVKSNDMAGGIEITSIGKEQLRMLLYYVDPYEQNPTIADMRQALNFGEIRQVSVPIKNGEVELDLELSSILGPVPTPKLRRFPMSQIVQNFKEQVLNDRDNEPDVADSSPDVQQVQAEPYE